MITIPGKIPIRIHPIFWILVLFISAINSSNLFMFFSWVAIIISSVVIHEMGHALTAVAFGQKAHIDLVGFGGLTHRHGPRLSAWKDFFIVLNGPLASTLLCLGSAYLLTLPVNYSQDGLFFLTLFMYANIFWTIVNLLPVQPLDGGHLLRILLEGFFGLRGVKAALFISLILAIGVSILFFVYNFLLGGVLFMMLTYENYRAWKSSLELTTSDQSEPLQQLLRQAQGDLRGGDEESAVRKLEKVREHSHGGVLYLTASMMLAEILSKQGIYEKVLETLSPLKNKLSPSGLRLLQDAACHTRQWDEAIAVGTLAYQVEPSYETALLNAIGHAHREEVQAAVGWLKRAINDGLPELNTVLRMSDFDPIRRDPLFERLSNRSG